MPEIAYKKITDPLQVDSLVYMYIDERTEVYVGESVEDIKNLYLSFGVGNLEDVESGVLEDPIFKFFDESKNLLNVKASDLLKQDIVEGGSIVVPTIIWTAYN